MLRIRLFRIGKKNQPSYKIVVVDGKRASRGGRFVEELGFINPKTKEQKIDAEKAKYWISKGAQPSDTVHNLLTKEKIIEDKKIAVHKKSKKKPAEGEVKTEEKKLEVKEDAMPEGKKEEIKPAEEVKAEETKPEEKPKEKPKEEKALAGTPEPEKKEETK